MAWAERIRAARTLPRHNLPTLLTPFVGREAERVEIARLLSNADCRLLTLVGAGGIGKTRLAIRAAEDRANEFLHGVCFVPLASVTGRDALITTLAEHLGCNVEGARDLQARLLNFLRDREMLLVLDNFEHLLAHTDLVIEILQRAPLVKILVTSRARLNLQAEWLFEVQGLEYPPTDSVISDQRSAVESYSAIQLFLQSARRVSPHFELTEADTPYLARICRFLQGMPLGIELAAATIREYTLPTIARQIEANLDFLTTTMRDVPEAHKSLRAVFEYSWNLLRDDERAALAQLSVFGNGWTERAAIQIADIAPRTLASLVDKFLVRRESDGRYAMLETIRQFAAEKLSENARVGYTTRERHSSYYAEFLRERFEGLRRGQVQTLAQVTEEIENVRAAWQWMTTHGKFEHIATALDGLALFYDTRNWFQEGEVMLRQAVQALSATELPASAERQRLLGKALVWQGVFAFRLAKFSHAEELLHAGLAIARALNQGSDMAFALNNLGNVADRMGDLSRTIEFLRESVARAREAGDVWEETRALNNLGYALHLRGETIEAQHILEETLARRRQLGDQPGIARTLINLGLIAAAAADKYSQAEKYYRESLAIFRALDVRMGMAICLNNLGYLAYRQRQYAQARDLYQQALALRREMADQWGVAIALENLGMVACATGEYAQAREYLHDALRIAVEIQATRCIVETLVSVAALWAKEGKPERAVELLGVALAHPALDAEYKATGQTLLRELQTALAPDTFDTALARKKETPLERVVEEVMQSI